MTDILEKKNKEVLILKYMLVGSTGAGKTSIASRFANNTFNLNTTSTTGIDFVSKNFKLQGKSVRLQIWDTSGQEIYRSTCTSRLKSANAVIFVYDISQIQSFKQLCSYWITESEQICRKETIYAVFGNKTDLVTNAPQIKTQNDLVLETIAQDKKMEIYSFAGSCKNDDDTSINEMMLQLTKKINKKKEQQQKNKKLQVQRSVLQKPPEGRQSIILNKEMFTQSKVKEKKGWCW